MKPTQPMTLTQKILAAHALGLTRPYVQAGDMLRVRVDWTLSSELSWNGMDRTYQALGRPPLHNRERVFLAVDHTVDAQTLARDARTKRLVQLSRDFARESGMRHFYDANQTILHTKFYRDLLLPGQVVLGADSHSSSHGGLGAFAIGLGGADVTAAMVLGESWIEVPEAIAVEYRGALPFGLTGKDVILKTLGDLKRNTVAMERTVEYVGEACRGFSTDMRFTIANMTAEFGGLNGIFEPDEVVLRWIRGRDDAYRAEGEGSYYRADADAPYAARYPVDLDQLAPQLARPYSPDNVAPVTQHLGVVLNGVFIGACTTTEEDLVLGALVLEAALAAGQVPAETTRRLVVPGDLTIQRRLHEAGLWEPYLRAGFRIGEPGCSMCLGVASEKAGPGEVWLSSQNRNFPNRMGEGSDAWLASAATVAASALTLRICNPRPLLAQVSRERLARVLGARESSALTVPYSEPVVTLAAPAAAAAGAMEQGGPAALVLGRVQRFGDHVDTDAIIAGQFCHLTDLKELGQHAFEFARPGFAGRVRDGQSIIVAEEGWGSGSSREHAVWALQGAGVQVVVAKSYAFIHKRNLVNEALPFLVVKDPDFYALCEEDDALEVDLVGPSVRHLASGRSFPAQGASPMLLALQRAGGLVQAIRTHGPQVFNAML